MSCSTFIDNRSTMSQLCGILTMFICLKLCSMFLVTDCPSTNFKCRNGLCIDTSYVCDGYNDCRDNSDENNCCEILKLNLWTLIACELADKKCHSSGIGMAT